MREGEGVISVTTFICEVALRMVFILFISSATSVGKAEPCRGRERVDQLQL